MTGWHYCHVFIMPELTTGRHNTNGLCVILTGKCRISLNVGMQLSRVPPFSLPELGTGWHNTNGLCIFLTVTSTHALDVGRVLCL